MNTTTNHHPSQPDPDDEFSGIVTGLSQKMLDAQLAQAAGSWTAMITHAGDIRKHAIKSGFGLRASKRLALAFVARCLGGDV